MVKQNKIIYFKKMAKKVTKSLIWAAVVIGVILSGYFYLQSKKPTTQYTTADVVRGNLARTVSSTGTFDSDRKYELAFKATGKVTEMNVDVGDRVTNGQILAKIDQGTLSSQLRQAEADVRVQKKTLDNMNNRTSAFTSAQRAAQRARVEQSEAGVDIINDQIKDTVISSPIDGVVLKRFANVGDMTFVNAARSTSILTVAPEGDMVIESNIPESDIVKVQLGQVAVITFDALGIDEKYNAKVTEIDPASTVIQDVVYYTIKLRLDKSDQQLKSGMSTNIDIHTAEKAGVLMIPVRAIQTEGKQKFVQILNADNTITKANIETGLEGDDGMTEVSSGVKEGQKVITFTKAA
jgi:RND family efflux transporter MFP subunit